jgi:hypothetical protein
LFAGVSLQEEMPVFRNALRVFLAFGLLLGSVPGHTQTPAAKDPEVLEGIRQVDEGDYDAAILTLDGAARRLARDPARAQEVAQAYLHLGVAYLGKGHEASARAQFREALARVKDLDLSPEKFAPKVIEAFEQARAESGRGAATAAPTPPPARPAAAAVPAPAEKKGGGKGLLIGGLVVAGVGGGVAVAAGGGGGGGSATPTPPPRRTETFTDNLPGNANLTYPIVVAAAGTLEATLTWTEPEARLAMDLHLPGTIVARSTPGSNTRATLTFNVSPQTYQLQVLHRGGCGDEAGASSLSLPSLGLVARPCSSSLTLMVIHP